MVLYDPSAARCPNPPWWKWRTVPTTRQCGETRGADREVEWRSPGLQSVHLKYGWPKGRDFGPSRLRRANFRSSSLLNEAKSISTQALSRRQLEIRRLLAILSCKLAPWSAFCRHVLSIMIVHVNIVAQLKRFGWVASDNTWSLDRNWNSLSLDWVGCQD